MNDFLGNFMVEMKMTLALFDSIGVSITWFRFSLVLVNFVIGALYFKKTAPFLLQTIWVALYLFIIFYFLIRSFLNGIGLVSNNYIQNSHLSLGLSVFTFGMFYLANMKLLPLLKK